MVGLDVVRALAVFGMFGAHVGAVAEDVQLSPATWLGVVNGRSSILFAVLASVSIALLSGRTIPVAGGALARARIRILVRAAWILAIGIALTALGTDVAVILPVYAVLFVLALPFLRWPPRRLLAVAVALAVLTPAADLILAQVAVAADSESTPLVEVAVTGAYPALIWWTFILVGLAVGRSELASARVRTMLLATGVGLAVFGYGGGWVTTHWWADGRQLTGPLEGSDQQGEWDFAWLSGAAPHSGTTFEIAGSVGFALILIAVSLVAAERLPTVTFPVASVGAMALSAYAGSIIAIWVIGTMHYHENGPWVAYILAALLLATAWRLLLGRGPLERLLTWSANRAASLLVR